MIKLLLLLFLLMSCTNSNLSQLRETNAINFEKDYSLSEFKKILETYNDLKEYPDIDKK